MADNRRRTALRMRRSFGEKPIIALRLFEKLPPDEVKQLKSEVLPLLSRLPDRVEWFRALYAPGGIMHPLPKDMKRSSSPPYTVVAPSFRRISDLNKILNELLDAFKEKRALRTAFTTIDSDQKQYMIREAVSWIVDRMKAKLPYSLPHYAAAYGPRVWTFYKRDAWVYYAEFAKEIYDSLQFPSPPSSLLSSSQQSSPYYSPRSPTIYEQSQLRSSYAPATPRFELPREPEEVTQTPPEVRAQRVAKQQARLRELQAAHRKRAAAEGWVHQFRSTVAGYPPPRLTRLSTHYVRPKPRVSFRTPIRIGYSSPPSSSIYASQ